MELYELNLPEPTSANMPDIIKIAKAIHEEEVAGRSKNTKRKLWEQYWVNVYGVLLGMLKS